MRTAAYAVGLAALWLVMAFINDGTTYHLAPLLVALVMPIGLALAEKKASTTLLGTASVIGAVLALGGTALLTVTEHLEGSSLLPLGGAVTEAVAFSLAGALAGFVLAVVTRQTR
jgi:hypothetical protein